MLPPHRWPFDGDLERGAARRPAAARPTGPTRRTRSARVESTAQGSGILPLAQPPESWQSIPHRPEDLVISVVSPVRIGGCPEHPVVGSGNLGRYAHAPLPAGGSSSVCRACDSTQATPVQLHHQTDRRPRRGRGIDAGSVPARRKKVLQLQARG